MRSESYLNKTMESGNTPVIPGAALSQVQGREETGEEDGERGRGEGVAKRTGRACRVW